MNVRDVGRFLAEIKCIAVDVDGYKNGLLVLAVVIVAKAGRNHFE
jgi:hypothetical protein